MDKEALMRVRVDVAFPGDLTPTPFTAGGPVTPEMLTASYLGTGHDPESPGNFQVVELLPDNKPGDTVPLGQALDPAKRYRLERRHALAA